MANGKPITIEKTNTEIIMHFPIDPEMPLTSTGKGRMICSTHGKLVTGEVVKNKHNAADNNLVCNCNLYVRATDDEAIELQATIKAAEEKAKNA